MISYLTQVLKCIPTVLFLFITSCKDNNFLSPKPSDEFAGSQFWQDPALTESFVNGIYSSMDNPVGGQGGMLKAEFVDEAHDMWYSYYDFNNCLLTSDDIAGWSHETWEQLYSSIRATNIFFKNIDNSSSFNNKSLKERLKGEAHFLRAYFYHQLVSLYGGVPIIKEVYGLDDNFNIARNSYAKCIQFIVNETNKAASLLPLKNPDGGKGRATKGAALALKSEVLLYAASELHDNNPMFSGFSDPELLGYISGSSRDRWIAAKNAAKDVMDLNNYSLFMANPAQDDDIVQNFVDLFLSKTNNEDIFVRYYMKRTRNNNLARVAGPNGYHLYGQNTPSGTLVDAYEMADGTKFSWGTPKQQAHPYRNRDPRFYASIYYEGADFRSRPPDVEPLAKARPVDHTGVIQIGKWEVWDSTEDKKKIIPGLDMRDSPVDAFNGGYTGYYLRKFIDPSVDGQYSGQDITWRFYRYGEILLNYAEACIALGNDQEARKFINKIRRRAGMPKVRASGQKLRERYRHERRIELAFESHRFYDVRRWVIAPKAYKAFTGVDVVYELNDNHTTSKIPTITPKMVQESSWKDKAYFFPIKREEMDKNNLLIQNPGYE